jgi:hypothetical protein
MSLLVSETLRLDLLSRDFPQLPIDAQQTSAAVIITRWFGKLTC